MSIENNWFKDELIKKKQIDINEIKEENKKQLEYKIQREKILVKIETENNLEYLKDLLNTWIVSNETAQKIIEWKEISNIEIKEIFEKINQIEEIKNINNYIPKEYRINKEDYIKAINDEDFREETFKKLDFVLWLLVKQIIPDNYSWLNLFSWFIWFLDKNLIKIQENTIDIKKWLKKIDKLKNIDQARKKSFWEKFIYFIKELFK